MKKVIIFRTENMSKEFYNKIEKNKTDVIAFVDNSTKQGIISPQQLAYYNYDKLGYM